MTLGMIHPPGSSGPFQDAPRLYFSEQFLSQPPKWCQVALPIEDEAHAYLSEMAEWDDEWHHKELHDAYEAIRFDRRDSWVGWFLWPRGTLITHEFPYHRKVIWRLTGLYFPLTTSTVYEGKWPD
jgi:hypothetical protein